MNDSEPGRDRRTREKVLKIGATVFALGVLLTLYGMAGAGADAAEEVASLNPAPIGIATIVTGVVLFLVGRRRAK